MSLPPLYQDRKELLSSLLGSTATRKVEVAAFLDQAWQVQEAQAAAGRESGRRRSERARKARKAIRQAAGIEAMADGCRLALVPLDDRRWPGWIADRLAHDQRFGCTDKPPCDDVIRDEWALLKMAPIRLA